MELGSKSDLVSDLQQINNLTYSIGRSLSVCTESNYVYEPLNISGVASGPNKTVQRTLNTGASFVHGPKSYLMFNVKAVAKQNGTVVPVVPRADAVTPQTNYLSFGEGSALNLIDEVIVHSKDGVDISIDRYADGLNNILWQYGKSSEYQKTSGSGVMTAYGLAPHGTALNQAPEQAIWSKEEIGDFLHKPAGFDVAIPMSAICRLFAFDKLLPSQLMSGLSISIKFKSVEDAFIYVGGNPANEWTYTIEDAYMRIATCDLADNMQAKIASMSEGKGGLKILIDDYYHERQSVKGTANVNVRANISQGLALYVKTTPQDAYNDITKDNFNQDSSVTGYYFRHGSNQYPKTEVRGGEEQWYQVVNAMDKNMDGHSCGVSRNSWFRKGRINAYNFERSDLELSGVALSNSKSLSFNATYSNSDEKYCDIWLKHSKLISVFLNNCVVES